MAKPKKKQLSPRATESDPMQETATDVELPKVIDAPTPVDPFAHTDVKDVVRLPGGFRCAVKFARCDDYVPFFACADDVEAHGRAIHTECAQLEAVPDYFPTDAEMLEATQERIARELRMANAEVTIYQDRVDIDDASDADCALLLWKTYRVALNRIPQQANYPNNITWPLSPTASTT